jgi:hypothetical protein
MKWLFVDTIAEKSILLKLDTINLNTKNDYLDKINILNPSINPEIYWTSIEKTIKLISNNISCGPTTIAQLKVTKISDKLMTNLNKIGIKISEDLKYMSMDMIYDPEIYEYDPEHICIAYNVFDNKTSILNMVSEWERNQPDSLTEEYYYHSNMFVNKNNAPWYSSLILIINQTGILMKCNNCDKTGEFYCINCGTEYCDKDCQKKHWKYHKSKVCNYLKYFE